VSVEILIALAVGVLIGTGTFLVQRPRSFPVVLGLVLMSHGVNLMLVAMGRVWLGSPPILSFASETRADPLAQALVLTAIVISFGMTAFTLVLAYRGYQRNRSERVDLEVTGG